MGLHVSKSEEEQYLVPFQFMCSDVFIIICLLGIYLCFSRKIQVKFHSVVQKNLLDCILFHNSDIFGKLI